MAPIFGVRRNSDEDDRSAGGKIVRSRRTPVSSRTPYARPQPRSPPEDPAPISGNLSWLSGLINPARVIASGAGKIISSVLGPDASSSSSSSSGGDSDSEYEDDVSLAGDDERNEGESMHLIQQLVMQETFSRDECDEMIKLIQSRVGKGHEVITDTDVRTTAVMEARKWLEDKKSGSGSKLNIDDQMCQTNQGILLSLVSESKTGSPVDMAKTFMHARPAWSSPSLKHVEFRIPSPMGKFEEEIPRSIFQSPLQLSELKRSSLSTGSWNILEEIRKVRAKATEELLTTTPSKKMSLPSFYPENKSRQVPLNSNPSLELATANCSGLPEYVEMEHDRLQNEALQTNNILTQSYDDEPIEEIQSADAIDGAINSSKDKVDGSIPNEKLEHEAEPSTAVHAIDSDSICTGSQNSSSAQHEDLLKDAIQSDLKRKANVTQPGRQPRGYSRRGRGRGRRGNGSS